MPWVIIMKFDVIAANGRVGSKIVEEARKRGIEVKAIVRDENNVPEADEVLVRDLFDLTYDDLKDADVVIDAFGVWQPELLHLHEEVIEKLSDILSNTNLPLWIVGGAGSLYMDPEHKVQLLDTPDFPEEYKPLAAAQTKALDILRDKKDLDWTFVSPAADFRADGEKTGHVLVGKEEFFTNDKGESTISYADYAAKFAELAQKGGHKQERIALIQE